MFFLGRKEIAASLFVDFLNSTTGAKSKELKNKIKKATKAKVTKNAQRLRKIFNKIWMADNHTIQRTVLTRRRLN
jgi:predicted nuclease of restriction endonuclease-like RecB superfamily